MKTNIKEQPMLFSAPMVRALLDGSKTQTRRVIKPQPESIPPDSQFGRPGFWIPFNAAQTMVRDEEMAWACPYGQPGSRIWVRETFIAYGRWETRFSVKKARDEWHFVDMTLECDRRYQYAADKPDVPLATGRGGALPGWYKRPAIFMPRAASRILLEIVSVRVERLQAISYDDAVAEGIAHEYPKAIAQYRELWEQINGAGSWDVNPWVWVVEFKRVQP